MANYIYLSGFNSFVIDAIFELSARQCTVANKILMKGAIYMRGRPPASFVMDDGKRYFFKRGCIDVSFYPDETKNSIMERIKEKIGDISISTIKGWLEGRHGPSDKRSVEVLAEVFRRNVYDFLEEDKRKDKTEMMKDISEYERMVVKEIYSEMLDMFQFIKWDAPVSEDSSPTVKTENYCRFRNQEEARNHYILVVDKTYLDLPADIRDSLKSLVNDVFGPIDDAEYNQMYFNSPAYKEYLENEGLKNDESRDIYAATFKNEMTNRLNEILAGYKKY